MERGVWLRKSEMIPVARRDPQGCLRLKGGSRYAVDNIIHGAE